MKYLLVFALIVASVKMSISSLLDQAKPKILVDRIIPQDKDLVKADTEKLLTCRDNEQLMTACPRLSELDCSSFAKPVLRLIDCAKPECYCANSTFRDKVVTGECYTRAECPDFGLIKKLKELFTTGKLVEGTYT